MNGYPLIADHGLLQTAALVATDGKIDHERLDAARKGRRSHPGDVI